MAITIADQYYIKALEGYPYDLEEVIEQTNYALSYDGEHVGALHLIGCVYSEHLNDYEEAEAYFQTALGIDPKSFKVCYDYCYLLIKQRAYDKAKNLIDYMYKLKEGDRASVFRIESLWNEYQKAYVKAIRLLELAKDETYNSNFMDILNDDIERVEEKKSRNQQYNWSIV